MKSNYHGCPDCKCKGPISRKEVAAKAAAARWGKRTAQLEDTIPDKDLKELADEPEKDWDDSD